MKTQESKDEDSRILDSLFSTTGVHSALQHDAIIGAARPETIIVEKEAKRIAAEAASALRESRKQIRKLKRVFVPTWTGRSGAAGAPSRPRFGKKPPIAGSSSVDSAPSSKTSSSAILNQLRKGSTITKTDHRSAEAWLAEIREYLSLQPDRQAKSAQLVSQFKDRIGPDGVPVFRKLLREVADFIKDDGDSKGIWKLKDEFV